MGERLHVTWVPKIKSETGHVSGQSSFSVCVCVCVPLSQYSHDVLGWLLDVESLDKCLQIELALLLIDHHSLR